MTVIKVENLWKQYRLGTLSHQTLTRDLQSWWARLRGKEDPNLRIDQVSSLSVNGSRSSEEHSTNNKEQITNNAEPSDRFWALKNVSFEVKQGEVLGIIGRNGAGKSTLLKIMSRVTTPTKGEIKIKGRVASLLEVGTGFHPELTGRENIFLNGAILGMDKTEIRKKFDEIVDFAEIGKFVDTPVKRYSSGMYVRLAFAVAAHLDPEILLVDEVLSVGDAAFQKKCLGKMHDVAGEGRTVLFVSHNMTAVEKLCPKSLWIHEGKLADIGNSKDVVRAYLNAATASVTEKDGLCADFLYKAEAAPDEDFAITAIQILDEAQNPMEELGTGDWACFRINYKARRSLLRGSVVLRIRTPEEVPMILVSTEPDQTTPCRIEPGEHYADCIFQRWPLAAGDYIIDAGLAIPKVEFVVWKENLCRLTVAKRDVYGSGLPPDNSRYLVAVDVNWQLPNAVQDE